MKSLWRLKWSLCLLLLPFCGKAQTDFCGSENKVIRGGEVVNFTVYYNLSAVWVAAGQASFTTRLETLEGRPVFHVIGAGKTYRSYDWIYKVDDRYESYIDTATMLPKRFQRTVNENGKTKLELVTFTQEKKLAFSGNKEYPVPGCIQDVLSAIYYARNIDYNSYQSGETIPFDMFIDGEVHHLYIRYMGRETITTKYGTFKTIKIRPLLVEGTIFSGGEKMDIYVTDDDNLVPVRINSPILVGSIKVDMMGYSGLKYPMKALVKRK
ncbi:MAG: DUF3108 domain-containing protein [Sphingobacteriales bacterium]|nr:MAG: DUF3108 domain-containing protein [Sphingobacteriales bacterium]